MGIRVAYGSVPKDGGTFTFYRNIRPELIGYDIDFRCASIGRDQAALWEASYADEGCCLIAPKARCTRTQSRAFSDWCVEEAIDIVIGVNSKAILSSLIHLPESIRIVSRCANAFDHGYKITLCGKDRLAAVIATTPRLQNDLINQYSADPKLISLIPNGINCDAFSEAAALPRGDKKTLRIGFLGRLENTQKGVFHIPKIVAELNNLGIDFTLKIAGKGKDRGIIENAMQSDITKGQVELLGALKPDQVPLFLGNCDVFLFTSHFEGCPNSLLEAMMAGCVPVASNINGITDFIIDHGKNGFLSETGDYGHMADQIEKLSKNRDFLKACSKNAIGEARMRFSSKSAATAYASVLHDVMNRPAPSWNPRPWTEFRVDPNFVQPLSKRIFHGLHRRIHRKKRTIIPAGKTSA